MNLDRVSDCSADIADEGGDFFACEAYAEPYKPSVQSSMQRKKIIFR